MSNAVVLDCPFCGAAAFHVWGMTGCQWCAARITMGTDAERLAMWNRRVVVGGKPAVPGT